MLATVTPDYRSHEKRAYRKVTSTDQRSGAVQTLGQFLSIAQTVYRLGVVVGGEAPEDVAVRDYEGLR